MQYEKCFDLDNLVMLEPDVDDAQEDHDADEDGDDDDVIRGLDI